jgi:serine phosphatase RsbU (regulator of sigma subunit)
VEVQDTEPLGMFVGFEPDITRFIGEQRIRLEPGELMVLYTDGVTDAVNRKGEEFGLRRLCGLVQNNSRLASGQILENLLSELYAFIGEARVHDDISLMVIKQK